MRIQMIDVGSAGWGAELDQIGLRLRHPEEPQLFPYHFLQVTFARIGGRALRIYQDERWTGVGFLFPRQRETDGTHIFTLRCHMFPGHALPPAHELTDGVVAATGGPPPFVYDAAAEQYYSPTHQTISTVDIGRPSAQEAAAVPSLHQRIWGSPPEFLYPADLHSVDFAAGTSLVARAEGLLAGFLIGFYKFGGPTLPADWHTRFGGDYRLESQIIGVLPEYRGLRIANLLKKVQAETAWREGIGIVNWTADPLQFPNAALNFGLLRGVAFDFFPDLYPFRNDLNRVHASRFGLTWLVGSARVREAPLIGAPVNMLDLTNHPEIPWANEGHWREYMGITEPMLVFEIPPNWTTLQQQDMAEAQRWRETTDRVLAHYIGIGEGKYVVTGVATRGDRRFLVAERAEPGLWSQLGTTT